MRSSHTGCVSYATYFPDGTRVGWYGTGLVNSGGAI